MAHEVQPQDVVVHLIRVLVESAKGIDLVVAAVRNRSVHEAGRALTERTGDLGSVAVHGSPVLHRRVGHDVGIVVGRCTGAWSRREGAQGREMGRLKQTLRIAAAEDRGWRLESAGRGRRLLLLGLRHDVEQSARQLVGHRTHSIRVRNQRLH